MRGVGGRRRASAAEPRPDCARCPRLAAFRTEIQARDPGWFNGAVPSFGDPANARVLIVGLAPGLKGANRTGRVFTGDAAGALLYATLADTGFARGTYGGHAGDGITLDDVVITNAVRCVPPGNKPTAAELQTCMTFLTERIRSMPRLQVIAALGRIAHGAALGAVGARKSAHPFSHGARHDIGGGRVLFDSYHCSRYNIQTGRLSADMFAAVFAAIAREFAQKSR